MAAAAPPEAANGTEASAAADESERADEDRRRLQLPPRDDRAHRLDDDEQHRPGDEGHPEPRVLGLGDGRVLGERGEDDQEREPVLEPPEAERHRHEAGGRDRQDGRVVEPVGADGVGAARRGRSGDRHGRERPGCRPLGDGRSCPALAVHGYSSGRVVSGSGRASGDDSP